MATHSIKIPTISTQSFNSIEPLHVPGGEHPALLLVRVLSSTRDALRRYCVYDEADDALALMV